MTRRRRAKNRNERPRRHVPGQGRAPSENVVAAPSGPPRRGEWLFTTREGAEQDLVDEFRLAGETVPRILAPAIVVAPRPFRSGNAAPTFARQGFPIASIRREASPESLAAAVAGDIAPLLEDTERFALHVWVPDSAAGNPLSADARALEAGVESHLLQKRPGLSRVNLTGTSETAPLIQICLRAPNCAVGGVSPSDRALSRYSGGRARMHVPGDRPSRSARKLAEALAWFGVSPESGELCVDLGAAPGGWTWLLLERRARVIAVDPGALRSDLLSRRGVKVLRKSAFDFEPDEPADWLFCDMAWRPLEVAELLGRWARKHSASLLVANFKLPMKKKAEMVQRVRGVLERSGWRDVRSRQLYHDRDEVTVTGRV